MLNSFRQIKNPSANGSEHRKYNDHQACYPSGYWLITWREISEDDAVVSDAIKESMEAWGEHSVLMGSTFNKVCMNKKPYTYYIFKICAYKFFFIQIGVGKLAAL